MPIKQEAAPEVNLYAEYRDVMDSGLKRTKLRGERIESFLLPSLKPAFARASGLNNRSILSDTPENRELIDYLRDDLFGKLPAYTSPIRRIHADGFLISGRFREILMDRNVGFLQLQKEFSKVDQTSLLQQAYKDLGTQYSQQAIRSMVIGQGSNGIERTLAARLIVVAHNMLGSRDPA